MNQVFSFLTRCLALWFAFTTPSLIFAQDYSALEWWENDKAPTQQVNLGNKTSQQTEQVVRLYFYCNDAFLNNFKVNFKSIGKSKDLNNLVFSKDTSSITLYEKNLDVHSVFFDYPISTLPSNVHVNTDISVNGSNESTNEESSVFVVTAQLLSPNNESTGETIIELFSNKNIKIWSTFEGKSKLNKEYGIFDIHIDKEGTITKEK